MPLLIVREDITKMKVDAIVTATNEDLIGDGGADGAIHQAAGPLLEEACQRLGGCKTGEAKLTPGFALQANYIVHTVGPIWRDGRHNEKQLLTQCYQNSLQLAFDNSCESMAFPLISSGTYGYPKAEAFQVAVQTIQTFLLSHDMMVYLVIFDKEAVQIGHKLFHDIQEFIDDNYVADAASSALNFWGRSNRKMASTVQPISLSACYQAEKESSEEELYEAEAFDPESLTERVKMLDESFSQMLIRKIDERGMKDSDCYQLANIDRRLFSKIRKDVHYHPKKTTVLAFAIALRLSLQETQELLQKAGLALSHSEVFDVIVEYFIVHGKYDIFELNEVLYRFDQPLLGGV